LAAPPGQVLASGSASFRLSLLPEEESQTMSRVLKRSWLATLVCLSLLISTLVPALAAPVGPSSQDEAIEFLKLHGIVQGDEFGRINEDSNITRAELA